MSFDNVPRELRLYNNWVMWRQEEVDGKLTKIPYQLNGHKASTTNPSHWTSFQAVADYKTKLNGHSGFDGIGFVFSEYDPFFGVDLDYTDNQEYFQRQLKIYNNFNSYSEYSPSGKGIHIIGYGSVPQGRKRDKIEIYSSGRFFTITGNVFNPTPIAHRQELLDILWAEMGATPTTSTIKFKPEIITDQEVMRRAIHAVNGEKFTMLFNGHWQGDYPSQSEADQALMNIIVYYTQNEQQIKRVFWASQLGKRDKAKRTDYLNRMVNKAFDQQIPEVDITALKAQFEEARAKTQEGTTPGNKAVPSVPLRTGEQAQAQPDSGAAGEAISSAARANMNAEPETVNPPLPAINNKYALPKEFPPGMLGNIGRYIMQQAPRPCYEIALVGAIGLMAGICGRAYNVGTIGLNYYITILADTGKGKEQIKSGYDNIFSQLEQSIPNVTSFDGPADFRSGQSFITYLQDNPCFVSVLGEFGQLCQDLNAAHTSENARGIKKAFLDLYAKSGSNRRVNKSVYSDKSKNTKRISSPSLTIVGETTPSEFYPSIDEISVANGFINRFTIIEYNGFRPVKNKNQNTTVPPGLLQELKDLTAYCLAYNENNPPMQVRISPDAEPIIEKLEQKATDLINSQTFTIRKGLWARADLKLIKLAALVAIGINKWQPVIDLDCVNWAYAIIEHEIENLAIRCNAGELGEESRATFASDDNQLNELIRVISKWMKKEETPKLDEKMLANGIYTFSALQMRTASISCFKKDKMGATFAFKRAIQSLLDSGDIQELNQAQISEQFGKRAKCFKIVDYGRFL